MIELANQSWQSLKRLAVRLVFEVGIVQQFGKIWYHCSVYKA